MKVGIIGLGLIGGSIAKGLKYHDNNIIIHACDRNEEDLKIALKENIISSYSLLIDESFSDLDYVFICVPVKYVYDIACILENVITNKNCIVCDIGSTKTNIVTKCEKLNLNYVGTHPMVGREKSGFSAANARLYDNSYFLVTTTNKTSKENIDKVIDIINLLNAKPYIIPLEKHDFVVSIISHIPHIVAYSLVNMTNNLEDDNKYLQTLAAGGFKDITRIASSSPEMWESICLENNREILSTLEYFKSSLNEIENYIKEKDSDNIKQFFKTSKDFRDNVGSIKKENELNTKIKNQPGELRKVINLLADHHLNILSLTILDDIDEKHGLLKLFFENVETKEKAFELLKNEGLIN